MNDHHRLDEYGFDLLTDFEKGDANVVPLTPNGGAKEPYICPGGELTIGYGCTKWFGGRDVEWTDRLRDEAHALELLKEQVVEYENAVRQVVTVPLNSYQFSALVCFAFNCGIKGFAGSTILRRTNERRFDDAAEAFSMWTIATTGQHRQRLRGLLRRRYAEACLFMGYYWEEAVDDDFIRMKVKRPPNLIGEDKVEFKTPFKEVLIIAQRYPLPPLDDELILTQPASPPVIADEAAQQPANPARNPAAGAAPAIEKPVSNGPAPATPPVKIPAPQRAPEGTVVLPSQVPKPPPVLPSPTQQREGVNGSNTPGIDPSSAKSMLLSRRFWGLLMVISGRVVFAIWGTDTLLKLGSDPLVSEMVANVMVMMAASAWEYCGEMLHTWGKVRARKPLR